MKTLVIIPAYNEEKNITTVVDELKNCCPDCDYVIINDGSTDSTEKLCRAKGYNYINLPINLGIGAGVQTGYRYALERGYDFAVQVDGDCQHDAAYIKELLAPLEQGTADMTVGSRFIRREGFQSSIMRRFGIAFLSGQIKLLSGVKVYDVTSGMRAVNRRLIELFAADYAQDYPEPDAILAAGMAGARVLEIPVQMRRRSSGKSTINPLKSVYYMIKVSLSLLLSGAARKRRKR